MKDLEPDRFEIKRATVRDGEQIAYVREGRGGIPLVLVHGWPGSKRLFWRNIEPLAEAGFEVIVPDARGFGDSSIPPGPREYADLAASARDIHELLAGLGHTTCVAAGGDWGAGVVQDLSLRFPGLVDRQAVWNGLAPLLDKEYADAGLGGDMREEVGARTDHMIRHAKPDEVLAALPTPRDRIDYVKGFMNGRVWIEGHPVRYLGGPSITDEEAEFQAEPFADAEIFRASLGYYEWSGQPDLADEQPRVFEPNADTLTLVMYGMDDEITGRKFTRRMEIATPNLVGPYYVEGSGHYIQWERADVFNRAMVSFCSDLLRR